MSRKRTTTALTKTEVQKMVIFAISHLPQLDTTTLENFLARVNANCKNTSITPRDLATQIQRTRRYFPNACVYSLQVVADLLDVQMKNPKATTEFLKMGVFASESKPPQYARISSR